MLELESERHVIAVCPSLLGARGILFDQVKGFLSTEPVREYASYDRDSPGEVAWFMIMGNPMMLLRKGIPADSVREVYGAIRTFLSALKANCVKMELLRPDLGRCDTHFQLTLEDQGPPVCQVGVLSAVFRRVCGASVYVGRFFQKIGLGLQVVATSGLWLGFFWLMCLVRWFGWWLWWFVVGLWLCFLSSGGSVVLLDLCVCRLVLGLVLVCGVFPWVYGPYLLVSSCVRLTSLDLCVCAMVVGFACFCYVI